MMPALALMFFAGAGFAYPSYRYLVRTMRLASLRTDNGHRRPFTSSPPWLTIAATLVGLGWAYSFHLYGEGRELFTAAVMTWLLVLIGMVDLHTYRIPNRLLGIGLVTAAPVALLSGFTPWTDGVAGMLLCGGFFLLASLAAKGGIGGGDVKLAAVLGLIIGWQRAILGLVLAIVAAAGASGILILLKRKGWQDDLPLGPFLAAGALAAVFWGTSITNWYLWR